MPIPLDQWSKLMSEAGESYQQRAARDAAAEATAKEEALKEQRLRDFFSGSYGPGSSKRGFNAQSMSVTAEPEADPYRALALRMQMSDRDIDNRRLETAALQSEHKKLAGKLPEQLKALDEIESLLQGNTRVTVGAMQSALPRAAGEVGALTESDVQRALPRSLRRDIKGLVGYVMPGVSAADDVLSEAEIANIRDMLARRRESLRSVNERANLELGQRANMLAPTLSRTGQLKQTLESLGAATAAGTQPPQPQAPQMPDAAAARKRLEELRAKYGRK